jgi:photosystem II stability/assembly factor-like uncharacterized protein
MAKFRIGTIPARLQKVQGKGHAMDLGIVKQVRITKAMEAAAGIFITLLLFCLTMINVFAAPLTGQKVWDDLFSVSFPTESEGWACGRWGTVLHSVDGGKTWARQETGTDYTLSSVSFVDAKHGWAVGDEGTIIHTSDGGKTWKKQKSPVPFFLMGVQFVTPMKGWIVTERTHILNTEDGGSTWKVQFKEDDFIFKAVSFCDDLNGWVVGEYGLIYHTKDGGKTWIKQAGSLTISDSTGKIEGGDQLFGVVAINPEVAWAVGIDGKVVRTTDRGKTWKNVSVPVPKNPLFCIAASRAGTIMIGGKRTFIWSADGGITWKVPDFIPAITYGWLYGLTHHGESGFVAVGWGGAIYRNDDSKMLTSWQKVEY